MGSRGTGVIWVHEELGSYGFTRSWGHMGSRGAGGHEELGVTWGLEEMGSRGDGGQVGSRGAAVTWVHELG